MLNATRIGVTLAIHTVLVGLIWFGIGYYVGSQSVEPQPRVPYVECDTDSDCLEKNGCGGYAAQQTPEPHRS